MDRQKRDKWLDMLRGAAVLLVLGRHLDLPERSSAFLVCWQRGGWVGVDLFFVLSGFLVSGVLFREYGRTGSLTLPRFLVRRTLRIYPAFLFLLLCTWLVGRTTGVPRVSSHAFLAELCFMQNYARGLWNHTWSLAVEEHFYLALPLTLLILTRISRGKVDPFGWLVPGGGCLMATLVLLRCLNAARMPYTHPTHLFPTHLRIDALGAGVMLAYITEFHRATFDRWVGRWRVPLLFLGTACFFPAFLFALEATSWIPTVGLTLFALGSVAVIAAGLGRVPPWPLRGLASVGGVSYSIYLWHMPVLVWGIPWCEAMLGARLDGAARIGTYVAGSIGVGAVMAALTERPLLRLRDRWFPARLAGSSTSARRPLRQCA